MSLPVYILIRTSHRPNFFQTMMESIKSQTYDNIITIVHSDDPRDSYIVGDIIIRGHTYIYGNGFYNLYNNRLLKAIPSGPGWYHFIDDDDMYAGPDVIERMVDKSKVDFVNVCHVQRWNNTIWPKHWGMQKSFQTECFFLHTKHKNKAKWWQHKAGDHNYSKKLTNVLPINWIDDVMICKAQEGKGHGKRLDAGKHKYISKFDTNKKVVVIGILRYMKGHTSTWILPGQIKKMKYGIAYEHEKVGRARITYPSVEIVRN